MVHKVLLKLASLAAIHWSGVLHIRRGGEEIGRIFLRDGQILWAESKEQEKNLYDILGFIGGLEEEEINFLIDLLVGRQEKSDTEEPLSFFSAIAENGYLSRWALREALRVHLYEALVTLESKAEEIEEEPTDEIVGGAPFTVAELFLGERLDATLHSMPDLDKLGVWRLEVWHPSMGPAIVWPKESPPWALFNYRFPMVLEMGAVAANQGPKVTVQYFSSSVVLGSRLPDPYGTLIMLEVGDGKAVSTLVTLLYYTPTFFILRALKDVEPLHDLI